MKIHKRLCELAALETDQSDYKVSSKLKVLADNILEKTVPHLKLIISQLPEFDLHDETHSKKVLENIELLLSDDVLRNLSSYELFLIYCSCYLHDSGMALPTWELNILKATEGTERYFDENLKISIKNDMKKPFKLSVAIDLIKTNKVALYRSFSEVENYIFSCDDEDILIRDLAEQLIDYQNFRNGYSGKLANIDDEKEYQDFSDLIRYEYIRETHAKRAEKNIKNLSNLFCKTLDGSWGRSLARDLALICKVHNENFEIIMEMELEASYFDQNTANLQFVAIMLRIGDILHFSYDRAPKSLFAEKMIESKISMMHWKTKFEGLNYSIKDLDENDRIKVKFTSFCEEPATYYFIQEYLNWADSEINNYFKFLNNLSFSKNTKKLIDRYTLSIARTIDRTQIRYDKEKFQPVSDAKFRLDQNKILELLMGVGLYKDKFLAIREIYQNSLDACRCMMSSSKNLKEANIEFGIESEVIDGQKVRYMYCIDNGIGMTEDIIQEYFLNIGNSYYNSKKFYRTRANWEISFKPTSQFGIGILSCFMIGNRIEVTTKPLLRENRSTNAISFSIDGPRENFYYKKADELDLERIGDHGTMIKVFLNSDIDIDNEVLDSIPLLFHGENKMGFQAVHKTEYDKWEKNLFKIVNKVVGYIEKNINVLIKFSNGEKKKLISRITPFDIKSVDEHELSILYEDFRYHSDGYNPFYDYKLCCDVLETYIISVSSGCVSYYTLITLPNSEMPIKKPRILGFSAPIIDDRVNYLVDGVTVKSGSIRDVEYSECRDLIHQGFFNFAGENRPQLSVDRNSFTDVSDSVIKDINMIPQLLGEEIIKTVSGHNKKYKICNESNENSIIWEHLFLKFNSLSELFLKNLTRYENVDIVLPEISNQNTGNMTVKNIIEDDCIELKEFSFKNLSKTEKILLLGKLNSSVNVQVNSNDVKIQSNGFEVFSPSEYKKREWTNNDPIMVKSDEWNGCFEEYDLVSNIWPIVSSDLFDMANDDHYVTQKSDRIKIVSESGNSIAGIANLDATLINPKFGISTMTRDIFRRRNNRINCCENIENSFWLFELNSNGQSLKENKDYFLFAYISPSALTDDEETKLRDYVKSDPEYHKGVKEGWSILFMGRSCETIILPGVVKRESILKMIKPSFWEFNKDVNYLFLDGSNVK